MKKMYMVLMVLMCVSMTIKTHSNSTPAQEQKIMKGTRQVPQHLRDFVEYGMSIYIDHATFVQASAPTENTVNLRQEQKAIQHQEDASMNSSEQKATNNNDAINKNSQDVQQALDQKNKQNALLKNAGIYPEANHANATLLSCIINRRNLMLSLSGVAGVYVVYYLVSLRTKHLLHSQNAWCNWDYTSTLNGSTKKLTHELLRKIQINYTNPNNPADYTSSIAIFLHALDQETQILRNYLTCMKFGSLVKLHTILPGGDMRAIAQEKLKTIQFLRNMFLEWARTHQEKFLA